MKTKTTKKTLYRIDINWYGETHTFHRYANDEQFALALGVLALAKKVQQSKAAVCRYVYDGQDRYLIKKEVRKNANKVEGSNLE